MVSQGLDQVKTDVSARFAPLAAKSGAAEKAMSRLTRLIDIQSACIAVLAVAVIVVLVMFATRS